MRGMLRQSRVSPQHFVLCEGIMTPGQESGGGGKLETQEKKLGERNQLRLIITFVFSSTILFSLKQ